jgi:predicted acetyltransferase
MQSHAYEGRTVKNLDDCFVLRRYRRTGVGLAAVRGLFAAWPGLWQINKKPHNTPAMAFWHRAVGEITGGRFRECTGQGIHVHIFEVPTAQEAAP